MEPIKKLAVLLLDDDEGITEEAYAALLDCLPEDAALALNQRVDVMEGRFYLHDNHDLKW